MCVLVEERYILHIYMLVLRQVSTCPWLFSGDLLIVMSQIMIAMQIVYEEKFMDKHSIDPLRVVGLEGKLNIFHFIFVFQFVFTLLEDIQIVSDTSEINVRTVFSLEGVHYWCLGMCISYCFTFYKENNARIKGNWQKEAESTVSEYRDECTLSLKKNIYWTMQ